VHVGRAERWEFQLWTAGGSELVEVLVGFPALVHVDPAGIQGVWGLDEVEASRGAACVRTVTSFAAVRRRSRSDASTNDAPAMMIK
jgi:hypothetical protein